MKASTFVWSPRPAPLVVVEEPPVVVRGRRAARDRRLPVVVGAAAAFGALVVQTWFRAGTVIAAGDSGPPLLGLSGVTRSWSHSLAGTGSTSYASASLLEGVVHEAVVALGGSDGLAQRLWYSLVFAALGAAVAWAAATLTRSMLAVSVAAGVAVLSPFHLVTLPNLLPAVAIVSLALIVGGAVRLSEGEHLPPLAGVLLGVAMSPLVRNPPLLVMIVMAVLAAVTLLVIRPGARRGAAGVVGWLVVGSLFWVVPLVLHHTLGMPGLEVVAQTDVDSWSWTQRHAGPLQVLRLVGFWAWGDPDTMGSTARLAGLPWSVLSLALPLAVVASVALARRRALAAGIATVVALFVVLASGINAPFGELNRQIYRHVPGYWLFRQPMAKFGVVLVIGYSLLIALGVDGVLSRRESWSPRLRRVTLGAAAVMSVAVVVFAHPLWTGSVIPEARSGASDLPPARVRVPSSWEEVGLWLDRAPVPGSVIVLPLADYYQQGTSWGYYGVDDLVDRVTRRKVLNLLPGGYYEPAGSAGELMRALEASVLSGDGPGVERLMQALGVGYVAVRTDLVRRPGRTLADAQELIRAASQSKVLRADRHFEHVAFFTIDDRAALDPVTSTVDVAVGTSTQDFADVVAATPTAVAVVEDDLRADTTHAWRSRGGTTSRTVAVSEGPHLMTARARAPLVWRASTAIGPSGGGVRLEVASTVAVDGVPLGSPGGPFLPAPDGAVGVEVDGMPLLFESGAVLFEADPTTTVRPLVEGTQLRLVDPAQATLGNCNNVDGGSLEATGVGAKAIEDGVAIWAAEGSACLALPVPAASSDVVSWRVHVPFTRWTGQATRVCLWLPREQKCADGTPPATGDREGVFDFVAALRPGEDSTGAQLMLYADKERGIDQGRTLTTYRGVSLAPVVASDQVAVIPQVENPRELRDLDGTTVELTVPDTWASNIVVPEPIAASDCHRYDDAAPEDVGIEFAMSGEGEEMLYSLAARRHSACVTLPIDVPPGLRRLTLELDHRSDPRPGRWCLIGQELTCIDSGPLPAADEWRHLRTEIVLPENGPAGARNPGYYRLVLYADGAAQGEASPTRAHRAQYRRVSVRATFPVTAVVQPVRTAEEPGSAMIVHHEAFAPQWSLDGVGGLVTARHLMVDGWANGWEVPASSLDATAASVSFWPDRVVVSAVWSLPLVVVAASVATVIGARRRRRRPHRRVEQWLTKGSWS